MDPLTPAARRVFSKPTCVKLKAGYSGSAAARAWYSKPRRTVRGAPEESLLPCEPGALWIGILALLAGCGPPRTPYPQAFTSQRPEERVDAVKHAAQAHDRAAIPRLVDRLEDEDEAVRFYAILALQRLTGTRMGYDYRAPEPKRHRAVQQWRRFLAESGAAKKPAATMPAPTTPAETAPAAGGAKT